MDELDFVMVINTSDFLAEGILALAAIFYLLASWSVASH